MGLTWPDVIAQRCYLQLLAIAIRASFLNWNSSLSKCSRYRVVIDSISGAAKGCDCGRLTNLDSAHASVGVCHSESLRPSRLTIQTIAATHPTPATKNGSADKKLWVASIAPVPRPIIATMLIVNKSERLRWEMFWPSQRRRIHRPYQTK